MFISSRRINKHCLFICLYSICEQLLCGFCAVWMYAKESVNVLLKFQNVLILFVWRGGLKYLECGKS